MRSRDSIKIIFTSNCQNFIIFCNIKIVFWLYFIKKINTYNPVSFVSHKKEKNQ